jgi:SAM-dependent methyltransferase
MLASDAESDLQHYISVGLSALENIEASLKAVGRSFEDVCSCLDFACGYGRVLRWLQTRITPERITACDVDRQAIRFCAREFDVKPLLSHSDFHRINFPETYDLIWVGSLLTHLPVGNGLQLLETLVSVLKLEGLLVFTTQGEDCLDHLGFYGERFAAMEQVFRQQIAEDGVYFAPYEGEHNLGITIHSRDYLRRAVNEMPGEALRLVRFASREWDDHQDVWTYQKVVI